MQAASMTSLVRSLDIYATSCTMFLIANVGGGWFRVVILDRADLTTTSNRPRGSSNTESPATPNFSPNNTTTTSSDLSSILFAVPQLHDRRNISRLLRGGPKRTTAQYRELYSAKDLTAALRQDAQQQLALMTDTRRSTSTTNASSSSSQVHETPVHICHASALIGIVRFVRGWYLVLATEKKRQGYIDGHVVYSVAKSQLLEVGLSNNNSMSTPSSYPTTASTSSQFHSTSANPAATSSTAPSRRDSSNNNAGPTTNRWSSWLTSRSDSVHDTEERYKSLFQLVDLTQDFYFSYTYDLTRSVQDHFGGGGGGSTTNSPTSRFQWNHHLLQPFLTAINGDALPGQNLSYAWNLPLVHGSFDQKRISIVGKIVVLTLLGRRSRFYAGTRYLKRGSDDAGHVANEVEIEQIVEADPGNLSSFVQVRGSIPTFWSQISSATVPKPPIRKYRHDPFFTSTRQHFKSLFERYGDHLVVLNLVRQFEKRPRESIVGEEFQEAVQALNVGLPPDKTIEYVALDFKQATKSTPGLVPSLREVAERAVNKVGYFVSSVRGEAGRNIKDKKQIGVVRTNCIDNLDRTNVGQYVIGAVALERQLKDLHVVWGDDALLSMSPTIHMPTLAVALDEDDEQATSGVAGGTNNNNNTPIFSSNASSMSSSTATTSRGASGGPLAGGPLFLALFERLGDRIAQQYGGSQAHKKGGVATTLSSASGAGSAAADSLVASQSKEILTSVLRYYSNAFTDRAKQDAINLFLGSFSPSSVEVTSNSALVVAGGGGGGSSNAGSGGGNGGDGESLVTSHLWDLETDFHLHNVVPYTPDFTLAVDPGTKQWWPPALPPTNVNPRRSNAMQGPPVRKRRPLFVDENDTGGAFVSFDDVLADDFFRPVYEGGASPVPASSSQSATSWLMGGSSSNAAPSMLSDGGRGGGGAGVGSSGAVVDEDSLEDSTYPTALSLGGTTTTTTALPSSSRSTSPIPARHMVRRSRVEGVGVVGDSEGNPGGFLSLDGERYDNRDAVDSSPFRSFVARQTDPGAVFRKDFPVDDAFHETMKDCVIAPDDAESMRRVFKEYGVTTGGISTMTGVGGDSEFEFSGLSRSAKIKDLFNYHCVSDFSKPLFDWKERDVAAAAKERARLKEQVRIFEDALR